MLESGFIVWLFKINKMSMKPRFRFRACRHLSESGYSLVEMMVGLFLSVFIVSLTLVYTITSNKTFNVHGSEVRMQENARFVFEIVARHLRRAGGIIDTHLLLPHEFIVRPNTCLSSMDTAAVNLLPKARVKTGPEPTRESLTSECHSIDSMVGTNHLAVRFAARLTDKTCDGSPLSHYVSKEQFLIQVLWVADIDEDGINSLYCQTINEASFAMLGNAVPLVEGIDELQIQYAVDSNKDGAVDVFRASNSSNIASMATDSEGVIKAIRIAILVNSGNAIKGESSTEAFMSRTYSLLQGPSRVYQDGRARQVFSTTIMLPNAHESALLEN